MNNKKFEKMISKAESEIIIIGINPIAQLIDNCIEVILDVLNLHDHISIKIYYESDSENFSQSLSLSANGNLSFSKLNLMRDRIIGRETKYGMTGGLINKATQTIKGASNIDSVKDRIIFEQINTRLPINTIKVDNTIYYSISTHYVPTLDEYQKINEESPFYIQISNYIKEIQNEKKLGIYNSTPGQELIQLYDNERYPRGIYPRSAFYTTKFKRYSVWGLVFNRNGELLLHQRSKNTKDNRLLWDKSVGGHVDLKDAGTQTTAKRELIEELFLPDDEYTKYVSADLGEILDFGAWNIEKRPETQYKNVFDSIGPLDWLMFRATDHTGAQLTLDRISERTIIEDGKPRRLRTVFISDIYLFISPSGLLDNKQQMEQMMKPSQESGAAEDHMLISPSNLFEWVDNEEEMGNAKETFTDDMIYLRLGHNKLLEEFSEFVQYIAK